MWEVSGVRPPKRVRSFGVGGFRISKPPITGFGRSPADFWDRECSRKRAASCLRGVACRNPRARPPAPFMPMGSRWQRSSSRMFTMAWSDRRRRARTRADQASDGHRLESSSRSSGNFSRLPCGSRSTTGATRARRPASSARRLASAAPCSFATGFTRRVDEARDVRAAASSHCSQHAGSGLAGSARTVSYRASRGITLAHRY